MCVPFYGSNNFKLLAYCLFYFIPTLVLMLCYGNVFHSKHMQEMRRATKSVSNNYALMNGGKAVNTEITSHGVLCGLTRNLLLIEKYLVKPAYLKSKKR